jgi:hypothetical protein
MTKWICADCRIPVSGENEICPECGSGVITVNWDLLEVRYMDDKKRRRLADRLLEYAEGETVRFEACKENGDAIQVISSSILNLVSAAIMLEKSTRKSKMERLKDKGWAVGDAEDFLNTGRDKVLGASKDSVKKLADVVRDYRNR